MSSRIERPGLRQDAPSHPPTRRSANVMADGEYFGRLSKPRQGLSQAIGFRRFGELPDCLRTLHDHLKPGRPLPRRETSAELFLWKQLTRTGRDRGPPGATPPWARLIAGNPITRPPVRVRRAGPLKTVCLPGFRAIGCCSSAPKRHACSDDVIEAAVVPAKPCWSVPRGPCGNGETGSSRGTTPLAHSGKDHAVLAACRDTGRAATWLIGAHFRPRIEGTPDVSTAISGEVDQTMTISQGHTRPAGEEGRSGA